MNQIVSSAAIGAFAAAAEANAPPSAQPEQTPLARAEAADDRDAALLSVIARHRAMEAAFHEPGLSDDELANRCAAADEVREELADTAPATLRGACALLAHLALDELAEPDSEEPLMRAVRNVERMLALL